MAIDRRTYEKYSGRTGDPMTRMGEALAQNAARRQANADARDRIRGRGIGYGYRRYRLICAVAAAIIALIAMFTRGVGGI